MADVLRLRAEQIEWRVAEGEVVVLDLNDSSYFAVNKTGAELWPHLAEGSTREELIARITDRFAVDQATASRDVDEFLDSVRERGLLTS
ncbi:MAG: hypothetical protein QOF37_1604 [Thermoleophilaceae bacterium]|jgi:hypothetical protein|nr:hypothetical protein [Thermoleophilaceae bacterium]